MNTIDRSSLIKFSQQLDIVQPSPVEILTLDWAAKAGVILLIKRDDLLHPIVSGNKWRKLCFTLANMPTQKSHIVSLGGGHSNHLHALGYICHRLGIRFTALVRGHYPALTTTLQDITEWGAQIRFLTKREYRERDTAAFISHIEQQYSNAYFIPEGGSQVHALTGVAALLDEITLPYDEIICPVASGGTLAGLIQGAQDSPVTGVAVLKGEGYLEALVTKLLPDSVEAKNWKILHQFHHGGYAKAPKALVDFCHDVTEQTRIPFEPVYSGKLLWAVRELVTSGAYALGTRLLLLHTGGVRGFV